MGQRTGQRKKGDGVGRRWVSRWGCARASEGRWAGPPSVSQRTGTHDKGMKAEKVGPGKRALEASCVSTEPAHLSDTPTPPAPS